MKRLIKITENQFKLLIKEVEEGPGDAPEGEEEGTEEDFEETEVNINPATYYSPFEDIDLEEFVITLDSETGETSGGYGWEYGGDQEKRRKRINWWKAKGIDTQGLGKKIKDFSNHYIDWMANNINHAVGPVITSGYRGPKSQINAMYKQWAKDKDYIKKTYKRSYDEIGKHVENYFTKYKEGPAKRGAAKFLKQKEKEGRYISNHQIRGAIDIGLFKNPGYNDQIKAFLDHAKSKKLISSYLDERDMKGGPHFHIKLA